MMALMIPQCMSEANTCIHYALATQHVAVACTACGYEPFQHQLRITDLLAPGKPGDANSIPCQVKAKKVKAIYHKIRSVQGTINQGLTHLLVPEDIKEDSKTCTG
jgi:hypothetical protein